MPIAWVDGVTDVNAANMEIIDTDIAARQVTAEKGAANGYAPLDASSKVPLVNLPPVSGVDYIGVWAAGTQYQPGQVVRHNGIDYLAVNPSLGQTPPAASTFTLPTTVGALDESLLTVDAPGSPPIWKAPAVQTVSYGTTLPASPTDGQEAILVDSITAPTYQWRFRYNAGSLNSTKWEFVGGASAFTEIEAYEGFPSANAWIDLGTVGPSLVVPRTGVYTVEAEAMVRNVEAPSQQTNINIGAAVNGTVAATGTAGSVISPINGHTVFYASLSFVRRLTLAANDQVRMKYYHETGSAGNPANRGAQLRRLRITPVRVL